MGPAIEPTEAPTREMPEEAELTWDAGDKHHEPALDDVPEHIVTKNRAATYLVGAFCFLGCVYGTAVMVDKPSKTPFVPKEFPYNGLAKELGRE
ncbi:unnamed product [Ostreococcus tauri]|nr:unnamed product [Ostreococcus tauri]CEF99290.1 unnamed product [Ostreococcus tauri]|eukprot:XP_003081497.2 unnamed product [Ostreococcus tauri]